MQDKIAVTVVGADDLFDTPPWVRDFIAAATNGAGYELNVYTEVKGGVLTQHADLVVGESVMSTGGMLPLMRHINKDSLALVARGAAQVHNLALGFHPCLITPEPGVEITALWQPTFISEIAWLMDVPEDVVRQLQAEPVHARLEKCRELVPDADERWEAAREQALQAVAFL